MNKSLTKWVCLVLAAILAASLFVAGCKEDPAETETETSSEIPTEESTEEPTEEPTEPTEPPEPPYELSLDDRYRKNGIVLNIVPATYEGVSFSYGSISGLIDDLAERRINAALFNHTLDAVKAFLEDFPGGGFYLGSLPVLWGSFSNVISVRTSLVIEKLPEGVSGDGKIQTRELYDNFELVNGRPITFSDLFQDDTLPEDIFGEGLANRIAYATPINRVTNEPVKGDLMARYCNPGDEARDIFENFREEGARFRFDEKGATLYRTAGAADYELYVSFADHLDKVMIYERYVTDMSLYENDNDTEYPVLTKRFPCFLDIYEESETHLTDAVFYADTTEELAAKIAADAAEKLRERIRGAEEGIGIYNAELSLYAMKNGHYDGTPSPYYVTVHEYIWTLPDEATLRDRKAEIIDHLQNEPEAEVTVEKTRFSDSFLTKYQADIKTFYLSWYYDADGNFLGERVLTGEDLIKKKK